MNECENEMPRRMHCLFWACILDAAGYTPHWEPFKPLRLFTNKRYFSSVSTKLPSLGKTAWDTVFAVLGNKMLGNTHSMLTNSEDLTCYVFVHSWNNRQLFHETSYWVKINRFKICYAVQWVVLLHWVLLNVCIADLVAVQNLSLGPPVNIEWNDLGFPCPVGSSSFFVPWIALSSLPYQCAILNSCPLLSQEIAPPRRKSFPWPPTVRANRGPCPFAAPRGWCSTMWGASPPHPPPASGSPL